MGAEKMIAGEEKRMDEQSSSRTVEDRGLRMEFKETISDRLSQQENLYFPRSLQPSASTPSHRKSLLLDLLSRDAAVFLERYGSRLTSDDLREFDVLKDDYEVNWHLSHLRSVISPSEEELKSNSIRIKNRRRAYMDKLISDGQYFSEDAMREREPYLHHEYLGKFQDSTGRSMARPGEHWSETLMRRSEEAMLVQKIREEQQKLGVAESDWVGNHRDQEEEEEEEEDDEAEDIENQEEQIPKTGQANGIMDHSKDCSHDHTAIDDIPRTTMRPTAEASLSEEEMQDRMDQFTYIMQQKFLLGEDHQFLDYSSIDKDETLDDHWMKEANYDAEEKYFADV